MQDGGKGDMLKFKWHERGGLIVVAPTRRGFGTKVLQAVFPGIRFDYSIAGLTCEFDMPLESSEPDAADTAASRQGRGAARVS